MAGPRVQPTTEYPNVFRYDTRRVNDLAGWMETIKSCFALKKEAPGYRGQLRLLGRDYTHDVNKTKAVTLAIVGLTLFILATAVAAIAILAIFFPPVGIMVGGIVALSTFQLGLIGGISLFVGLVGLTFGAAAVRTLHRVAIDAETMDQQDNIV